jgi:hypothetical protein
MLLLSARCVAASNCGVHFFCFILLMHTDAYVVSMHALLHWLSPFIVVATTL